MQQGHLLVDTYDTLAVIDKIIDAGLHPKAVRLDSGNLVELSREVRRRLDQGGLDRTRIFVTSDLDEYVITEILARGAQVDAFGVGASLATSKDAPALGGVYKLVDVYSAEGPSPRAKLSGGMISCPGCKRYSAVRARTENTKKIWLLAVPRVPRELRRCLLASWAMANGQGPR